MPMSTAEDAKQTLLDYVESPTSKDILRAFLPSAEGRGKIALAVMGSARCRLDLYSNTLRVGKDNFNWPEPMTPALWAERATTMQKDINLYDAILTIAVDEEERNTPPMRDLRCLAGDFKGTRDAFQARAKGQQ